MFPRYRPRAIRGARTAAKSAPNPSMGEQISTTALEHPTTPWVLPTEAILRDEPAELTRSLGCLGDQIAADERRETCIANLRPDFTDLRNFIVHSDWLR